MGGQERLAAPPHPTPCRLSPSPSRPHPPPVLCRTHPVPSPEASLGRSLLRTLQMTLAPPLRFSPVRRPLPSVSPWSGFTPCRLRSAPPRLQEETSCSGAKSSRPGNSREITRGVARLPAKIWGRKEGEGVLAGHREAELCETDTRGTHCSKEPEGERVR